MTTPIILNVDDNERARYMRTRILREAGFKVFEANTGAGALDLLKEQPDLVLLDVNLPDMSGVEVCGRIKNDPQHASVVVLHISASAIAAPQATHALEKGADSYLIEPVDPDVLVATIRAMLRLRRAERELAQTNAALREANANLTRLNLALQRSNEDLEHFAYLASHDLQEPLRTITTHLQLVSRSLGPKLTEPETLLFGFVVDAASRMGTLINDILTYSRVGREGPELQAVTLSDAVIWAVKNLEDSVRDAGASIEIRDLPTVWGDSLQLSQVFQNLIGNSLKYRSKTEPPRITVSAAPGDGDWIVSVADNGVGIPAEYSEDVFRAFKRLHGREIPGTGIGLALCRRVIERHGGRIWVVSEPGEGSRFSFTLRPAEQQARSFPA